ncbi:MAG: hypothetical protein SFU54_00150 [Microcella sp.]|nr:hypothetical protein [Microcella sp.]
MSRAAPSAIDRHSPQWGERRDAPDRQEGPTVGIEDIVDKAKDIAGDVAEKAKDVAGDVADNAKEFAGDVKEFAGDAAEKAKEFAGDAAEKAKDVAGDIKDRFDGDEPEATTPDPAAAP